MIEHASTPREAFSYLLIAIAAFAILAYFNWRLNEPPPKEFMTKHDRPPVTMDTLPMVKIPATDNYILETDSIIYIIDNEGKLLNSFQK